MNRFHVHVNVADLDASVKFYSELFAASPSVLKPDYAKWLVEDPRLNFAISTVGGAVGIDHLGIQVDDADALAVLGGRLEAAGGAVVPEAAAVCCYAQSEKLWTEDPQGTRWETFVTTGEATSYYAIGKPCATDGASCSPDLSTIQPTRAGSSRCCPPASTCC
jgi:predicted enzyme related to lactoylglutathione lyase